MAKAATKLKTANIQEELEKEATFFLDEASKYGKLSLDQKLPTYGRNYYRELTGVALNYAQRINEALKGERPVILNGLPVVEPTPAPASGAPAPDSATTVADATETQVSNDGEVA